jgi:cold shock protein
MLKIAHLLVGLAALLLSLFSGFATPEGLLATPNALYLALIALLNLALAPSATNTAASARQQLQSIASALLILAAVLQALVLLAPLPSIGNQPAIWLSLLIAGIAIALHLACQLPRETGATQTPQAKAEAIPPAAITTEEDRETGTVKWFNTSKGFGFISRDSGEDIFVHFRAIRGEGHRVLVEGQRVEFSVMQRDKGLQAEDVIAAAPPRR